MLIGNKKTFAIELSFENFYDDEWIAWGAFRMFVGGCSYGIEGTETTYFYLIFIELKKIIEENVMRQNLFKEYSDQEIVDNYHLIFEELSDEETDGKLYLGMNYKNLPDCFYDFANKTEMAFNDGSNVLMFRNESYVRLIGYRSIGGMNIKDLNGITITREEFDNIIQKTLKTILSERDRALKKVTKDE